LTGAGRERLFTPRFFVMCGFTFTVFLSAFQLLPTAPYRILAMGGGPFAAGLFLGFLTYASAFSAPLTGALADRIGKRRMLVGCGLALTAFALAYAVIEDYRLMLGLVHAPVDWYRPDGTWSANGIADMTVALVAGWIPQLATA